MNIKTALSYKISVISMTLAGFSLSACTIDGEQAQQDAFETCRHDYIEHYEGLDSLAQWLNRACKAGVNHGLERIENLYENTPNDVVKVWRRSSRSDCRHDYDPNDSSLSRMELEACFAGVDALELAIRKQRSEL